MVGLVDPLVSDYARLVPEAYVPALHLPRDDREVVSPFAVVRDELCPAAFAIGRLRSRQPPTFAWPSEVHLHLPMDPAGDPVRNHSPAKGVESREPDRDLALDPDLLPSSPSVGEAATARAVVASAATARPVIRAVIVAPFRRVAPSLYLPLTGGERWSARLPALGEPASRSGHPRLLTHRRHWGKVCRRGLFLCWRPPYLARGVRAGQGSCC